MTDNATGYRSSDYVIPGFNLAIIDVDGQISLDSANWLLKGYKYLTYTTKRHTPEKNRFRMIFPLSHKLHLNKEDYKEFMDNFFDWLPFKVDEQTGDYSRKWMTHPGMNVYHEGDLIDAQLFIPKTKKAEERRQILASQSDMDNVERWFLNKAKPGNRNNHLIRYGLMLVDSGLPEQDIHNRVVSFNNKLGTDKLNETENETTISRTLSKKVHDRDK